MNLGRLNAMINNLIGRMSVTVNALKSLAAVLLIPLLLCGAARSCYADDAWYESWDALEAAASRLYVDEQITEMENTQFDEIAGLARSGETDEAIKTLKAFLKDNRNDAMREVTRNAMVLLVRKHRQNAAGIKAHAMDRHACTLDLKVCANGAVVGREGPRCAFAQCPDTSSADIR